MKFILPLILIAVLSGCGENKPKMQTDQCLRAELFQQCLQMIPKGPTTTVYNDWAEVVDECSSSAYSQSRRFSTHIKDECRAH